MVLGMALMWHHCIMRRLQHKTSLAEVGFPMFPTPLADIDAIISNQVVVGPLWWLRIIWVFFNKKSPPLRVGFLMVLIQITKWQSADYYALDFISAFI